MRFGFLALAVAGCGKSECVPLVDGDWTMDGDAFGMVMGGQVVMDAEACTFTLGQWSMPMDSLPTGGSIVDDQVAMDGDSFWKSCSGTVTEDGTFVDGECKNGDGFTMDQSATGTLRP